jgi:hypothetical protein
VRAYTGPGWNNTLRNAVGIGIKAAVQKYLRFQKDGTVDARTEGVKNQTVSRLGLVSQMLAVENGSLRIDVRLVHPGSAGPRSLEKWVITIMNIFQVSNLQTQRI